MGMKNYKIKLSGQPLNFYIPKQDAIKGASVANAFAVLSSIRMLSLGCLSSQKAPTRSSYRRGLGPLGMPGPTIPSGTPNNPYHFFHPDSKSAKSEGQESGRYFKYFSGTFLMYGSIIFSVRRGSLQMFLTPAGVLKP